MSEAPERSDWIFGYGSLIWRRGFDHDAAVPAYLDGYARRFWQGSPDHRGTPDAPGRVVTLLPARGARTFGVAYRPVASERAHILDALDHREKAGYERRVVDLDPTGQGAPRPLRALVYIATADNESFLGPAPTAEMAAHIARSHGPSGPNAAYLLRLREALRAHRVRDPHVETLAAALGGVGSEGATLDSAAPAD